MPVELDDEMQGSKLDEVEEKEELKVPEKEVELENDTFDSMFAQMGRERVGRTLLKSQRKRSSSSVRRVSINLFEDPADKALERGSQIFESNDI